MYTLTYVYFNIHNYMYISNQAIHVAKLCFYCAFSLQIPHKYEGHVTLTLTLSFNFC